MEKEYTFCLDKGHEKKDIVVKESDLSKPQKDLLMGELIKVWNNIPNDLKREFINDLANELAKANSSEEIKSSVDIIANGLGK